MSGTSSIPNFDQFRFVMDPNKGMTLSPKSPSDIAQTILQDTQNPSLVLRNSIGLPQNRIEQIEARIDSLAQNDPALADSVRAEVIKGLSPMDQGKLLAVQDGVMKIGPDGQGYNYAESGKGMNQDQWIANAKANGHPDYAGYVLIAGSDDVSAVKKAMDDVYNGRAVLPIAVTPDGNGWKDPAAVERAQQGQNVMKGVGIAHGGLVGSAEQAMGVSKKSPLLARIAPGPANLALSTIDAKLKYDELRAKGFSEGAAWIGVAAGQAASKGLEATGTGIGIKVGVALGSPSGPGAIGTGAVGGIAGNAVAGLIDWAFDISDSAALAAANEWDGKKLK